MNQNKLLHKEVFKDNDDFIDYFFDNIIKANKKEIIVDGELASAVYWKNMPICFENKIGSSIFLTSVATKDAYRRKGMVRKLVNKLINESKTGCILLHPFNHSFYEKLGFITINYHLIYDSVLSKINPGYSFLKIGVKDAGYLCKIYENNYVYRAKRNVKYFEEMITYFQKCGDLGYLIIDKDIPISYYFFADNRIVEFAIDKEHQSKDLSLYNYFVSYNNKLTLDDKYSMGRICNVKEFFLNYTFSEQSQNFTINILDSINPENHNKFTFFISNRVAVKIIEEPLDIELADITLDISVLTAIAFGNKNAYIEFFPEEFLDNFNSFGFTLFDIY